MKRKKRRSGALQGARAEERQSVESLFSEEDRPAGAEGSETAEPLPEEQGADAACAETPRPSQMQEEPVAEEEWQKVEERMAVLMRSQEEPPPPPAPARRERARGRAEGRGRTPSRSRAREHRGGGGGLELSAAPHIAGRSSERTMMAEVLVAALPALLFSGFYFFGYRVFAVTGVSVAACAGFEILYRLLLRQRQTVGDLSAVVTGVLLAMTLPVTVPYWVVVIGAFFAIVVVKLLYGGLGKNFMNPALAGRVFLFSFPALVNTWAQTRTQADLWTGADAVTAATPMAALHAGSLPQADLLEMFTGIRGGAIGEVSAALVLLGGMYLVVRRVIRLRIPVSFVGTVAVLTWAFPAAGVTRLDWMLYQLMSGGLLLGAFFMATDPVTSPVTRRGQVLYGVGCGAVTVFLRYHGSHMEGVAFAILIMNALSWLLDRCTRPRRYGVPLLGGDRGEGAK